MTNQKFTTKPKQWQDRKFTSDFWINQSTIKSLLAFLQIIDLCQSISAKDTFALQDLSLWGVNLGLLSGQLLGSAARKLKKVDLSACYLSTSQLTDLLATLNQQENQLRILGTAVLGNQFFWLDILSNFCFGSNL